MGSDRLLSVYALAGRAAGGVGEKTAESWEARWEWSCVGLCIDDCQFPPAHWVQSESQTQLDELWMLFVSRKRAQRTSRRR